VEVLGGGEKKGDTPAKTARAANSSSLSKKESAQIMQWPGVGGLKGSDGIECQRFIQRKTGLKRYRV